MAYKFEQLDVWQLAMEYVDLIYTLSDQFPRSEEYNLKSQIRRAATSVALNIAEGSTGQSDPEQARFLGMAILKTKPCLIRPMKNPSRWRESCKLFESPFHTRTKSAKINHSTLSTKPNSSSIVNRPWSK